MTKQVHINWDQITKSCKIVSDKLCNAGCNFDAIICMGRGGMVPTRLISEYLNIKEIHYIPVRYDGKKIIVGDYNFSKFENKDILIIDEVYTTGKSIKAVADKIFDATDNVTLTDCTCYRHKDSKYKPDVWAYEYDASTDWLVFPWETTGDDKNYEL